MRYLITILTLLFLTPGVKAQSKTTEALQKQYNDCFSLFFYNNTLRMINQQGDKEFDELIKDIEKMKLLIIRKADKKFNYSKLTDDYKKESFEEIMTSRHEGKNFDVYLKEKNGKTKAMLVLVNDNENLFVLDILGRIALDEVTKLYSVLDEGSDISKRIERFVKGDDDKDKESKTKK